MVAGLLDGLTGGGAAAVTAPRVTLAAAPGGGTGGGIGGGLGAAVADAVGGLLGGDGGGFAVERMTLTRGLLPDLDEAALTLAPAPGAPALPALDDALTLSMTAGDAAGGLTGAVVERAERRDGSGELVLGNGGTTLARLRVDAGYTDSSPGDIIADLAGQAGLSVSGPGGESLPRVQIDGATPAHLHVARLATLAGVVVAFDDDGTLRLIDDSTTGEPVATLVAGETLLDWQVATGAAPAAARVIDGAGAGAGERWAWLSKAPGPMRSGDTGLRNASGALRSPAALAALGGALGRRDARAAGTARFLALAQPAVAPGRLVTVEGVAGAGGRWFVTRVVHRFAADGGFTTEISAAPAGGGGGLGGLLGGLA